MSSMFAGRYVLLRPLGSGGMANVWLARDTSDGRECAVKHVRSDASAAAATRLRHEFEALAALRHPALVRVHDLGFTPAGEPFLTMDYVPGEAADKVLPRGDWSALGRFAVRVTRGLEALHAAGIVHGDIKPSNLLVPRALGEGAPAAPGQARIVDLGLSSLRLAGGVAFAGTPGFAAPEVVGGEVPGPASDLYSLGATLHVLATGEPPDAVSSSRSSAGVGQARSARALERAGLPAPLVRLVLSLLAMRPEERPASATELAIELESLLSDRREPLLERLQAEVFAGRDAELGRFAAALASPRTSLLLFEGDAGAGKTSLLAQCAVRAALADRGVLRVGQRPDETVALLRQIAALPGVHANAADALRSLAAGEHDVSPAQAWDRVADALLELANARRTPVLLVDDTEHLDAALRASLLRLLLHPKRPPLVAVWSARSFADLDPGITTLIDAGRAQLLPLEPLDRAAVERLVEARLGQPAPVELLDAFESRAGGQPGDTVELLRRAVESGAVGERDGVIAVDNARLAALAVPGRFEDVLTERAEALPPAARRVLTRLAAFGGALDDTALADGTTGEFTAGVAAALASRIVRRPMPGQLAFVSPALAERWLASRPAPERDEALAHALTVPGLAPTARCRLLADLGQTVAALELAETLHAAHPEFALAARAAETAAGVADPRAGEWFERAGDVAFQTGRYDDAGACFARAQDGARNATDFARRAYKRARVHERRADADGILAVIEPALSRRAPEAWDALLRRARGVVDFLRGHVAEARAAYEDAYARARASRDAFAISITAEQLAWTRTGEAAYEAAEALAREAIECARRANDVGQELQARRALSAVLRMDGRFDDALREQGIAVEIARSRGAELPLADLHRERAITLFESGQWRSAREAANESLRRGLAFGGHQHVHDMAVLLGTIDLFSGNRRAVKRHVRLARRFAPGNNPVSLARIHRLVVGVLARSGDARRARRLAARSLSRSEVIEHPLVGLWLRIEDAAAAIALGRWDAVSEVLAPARDAAAGDVSSAIAATLLGRAVLRQNNVSGAREHLAVAAAFLMRRPRRYLEAHVEQLRAELALATGEPAADLTRHTLGLLQGLPAACDAAAAALEFATLALQHERDRDLPVAGWLDLALDVFERVGDQPRRIQVLTLQAEQAMRTAPPSARSPEYERALFESVGTLLHSLSDPEVVARRALDLAGRSFGAERGALLRFDPETRTLTTLAEFGVLDAGARERARRFSRRVVEHVLATGLPLVLTDAKHDTQFHSKSVMDLRLRSIVCVPLAVGGRVIGAVYLDDSRRAGVFAEAERGLLEGFAHLVSAALGSSLVRLEVERSNEELLTENTDLRRKVGEPQRQGHLYMGQSPEARRVQSLVELAARRIVSVLINGETGTGKELVAKSLHHLGPRASGPFVDINCGALPPGLLEAEVFGIEAHVATGVRPRPGMFVRANGGTLFLDEIGEMPLQHQVALLKVLQDRQVTPIGASQPIPVDVRVIAATNRDLPRLIHEGKFREDLYHRLAVIVIDVPPLRDRKSDIPMLAQHFAEQASHNNGLPTPTISQEFMATLIQNDWPGNVRQLLNYIESAVAMTLEGPLKPTQLPRDIDARRSGVRLSKHHTLGAAVEELERKMISRALDDAGNNQSEAARSLGIGEQTLRYKLSRLFPDRARKKSRVRKIRR